ncbi:MAG: hypothetical protein ACE5GJ_02565 [Gemmatimonadota bacterium]
MSISVRNLPDRLRQWLGRLSGPALALIGVVIAGAVTAGGYYAYRTYDYIQHDNDFCMSCHLMQEPFERFSRSAHRGLSCKACHQPDIITRSKMALTQVIENPEELGTHAEVPNRVCAECHIKGDPKKWEVVAQTAGHRVHLESDDPDLQGLQCVECHSVGIHEFAAADQTCSQSGCHEDSEIRLAGMADLTVHCAACHGFSVPTDTLAPVDSALKVLRPNQSECLSCHTMRSMVQLPDPDPHAGACGACHNAHTQERPQDAVESCTNAGCHAQPDTLSPFHRGMEPGVLEDCSNCHNAHDFHVEDTNCLACHADVLKDIPPGGIAPEEFGGIGGGVALPPQHPATHPWSHAAAPEPPFPQEVEGVPFRHGEHRDVECLECHSADERHGALKVTGIDDCRSCHHAAEERDPCTTCHTPADAPADAVPLPRPLHLTVDGESVRELPFRHPDHEDLACGECHTDGLELSARDVDCLACHEDHHEPDVDCTACHVPAPEGAHPREASHLTCTGAGCHVDPPLQVSEIRARQVCLSCHQDESDHKPGEECVDCHLLPHVSRAGRVP